MAQRSSQTKKDQAQATQAEAEEKLAEGEDTTPDAEDSEPTVVKVPVARLVAEAEEFLGLPSFVVAGALHGESRKELTVEQARSATQKWLAGPYQGS